MCGTSTSVVRFTAGMSYPATALRAKQQESDVPVIEAKKSFMIAFG